MTVIAWDGKTLAADKRMVSGGGIARTVTKIWRGPGRCLMGITGSLDTALEMVQWYSRGAEPKDFPAKAREDVSTLIVILKSREIATFSSGPFPAITEDPQAAWGSGRDFAEAAMHLGKTSTEAVEVACNFQSDCGNGIDTLTLEIEE